MVASALSTPVTGDALAARLWATVSQRYGGVHKGRDHSRVPIFVRDFNGHDLGGGPRRVPICASAQWRLCTSQWRLVRLGGDDNQYQYVN